MTDAVLSIEGLRTHFFTKAGVVKAVDDVSFSVARGEVLGLVGESGSGKVDDRILDHGPGRSAGPNRRRPDHLSRRRPRARFRSEAMRQLRGNRIAMIFQDPMMTLNPVLRIETQMVETILAHERVPHEAAVARARAASCRSASRRRTQGSPPIRTSSPAACGSAWRSRSRC